MIPYHAMATETVTPKTDPVRPAPTEQWTPRIWEGFNLFAWIRLLVRNRFAVSWRHLYIAVIITIVSTIHTILRAIQQAIYGRRIAATPIRDAPIFIIGHWRTGTTLLHE